MSVLGDFLFPLSHPLLSQGAPFHATEAAVARAGEEGEDGRGPELRGGTPRPGGRGGSGDASSNRGGGYLAGFRGAVVFLLPFFAEAPGVCRWTLAKGAQPTAGETSG